MRMKKAGVWIAETFGGLVRAFGTAFTWCVILTFVAVTAVSILWKLEQPPVRGLDHAAATLPSLFYADMMSMEITQMSNGQESSSFSSKNVASFLTRLTTGIDPADPRTLAAQMLPGGQDDGGIIIVRGIGTGPGDYPVEVPPAPHLQSEGEPSPPPEATQQEPEVEPESEPTTPMPEDNKQQPEAKSPNVVFVYHSHPQESFLPELEGITKIDEAYDNNNKEKTITSVGQRLTDTLTKLGIGSLHSDKQYAWRMAYNESRKTVKAVMQNNEQLSYFIDIHRDSMRREKTTLTHEGKDYAKIFFVIGQKNPNYKQNEAFANELHNRIEAKIKGLSRGVVRKNAGSNGEFNQSLSPKSILIEIGGVDNTLEEGYRTADVFAEVLAELYWDEAEAVKADTEPAKGKAADQPASSEPDTENGAM
jgi:stage II sporulation protein P